MRAAAFGSREGSCRGEDDVVGVPRVHEAAPLGEARQLLIEVAHCGVGEGAARGGALWERASWHREVRRLSHPPAVVTESIASAEPGELEAQQPCVPKPMEDCEYLPLVDAAEKLWTSSLMSHRAPM